MIVEQRSHTYSELVSSPPSSHPPPSPHTHQVLITQLQDSNQSSLQCGSSVMLWRKCYQVHRTWPLVYFMHVPWNTELYWVLSFNHWRYWACCQTVHIYCSMNKLSMNTVPYDIANKPDRLPVPHWCLHPFNTFGRPGCFLGKKVLL